MIEFKGELTGNCRRYIIKKIRLVTFEALCFTSLFILIPSIILTVYNKIFFFVIILGIVFPFVVSIPSKKDEANYKLPNSIIITDDNKIILSGQNVYNVKYIDNIKRIIDYGEWYHIIFHISTNPGNYVCQKDLIKVGTIEEFENLFKDKIIRKTK